MKTQKILFFVLFTFSVTNLFSQFIIDSDFRTRFEFRNGYQKLAADGDDPACFVTQRSRIGIKYETTNLKIIFIPQDVRTWGNESIYNTTGVFADQASVTVYQAYSEIKIFDSLWISVGRQELVYDNQRILSNRNFNFYGLAYDAGILKYKNNKNSIHLGSSWNSNSTKNNFYFPILIKSFSFLWLNKKINDKSDISLVQYASGSTESDTTKELLFKFTSGIYTNLVKGDFKLTGDFYYQYGKSNTFLNVNAFFAGVDLSYNPEKFSIGIGADYNSGNKSDLSNKTEENMFDLLYGARHGFYGHMDYFSDFSKATAQGGLVDCFGYLKFNFGKKIKLTNQAHYFMLAQTNSLTLNDKKLGFENDLTFDYKFNKWGKLTLEYMFFLPQQQIEHIQGITNSEFSHYFYIQLSINPVLFKQEKKSE